MLCKDILWVTTFVSLRKIYRCFYIVLHHCHFHGDQSDFVRIHQFFDCSKDTIEVMRKFITDVILTDFVVNVEALL